MRVGVYRWVGLRHFWSVLIGVRSISAKASVLLSFLIILSSQSESLECQLLVGSLVVSHVLSRCLVVGGSSGLLHDRLWVPRSCRKLPRYPFGEVHLERLGGFGEFDRRVFINLARIRGGIYAHCVVWWLGAGQNQQKEASSTVVLDDGGENDWSV